MQFVSYVRKNIGMIIGATLITVLCQGRLLLSSTVGIDTEALIVDKESLLRSWLTIGRQGLVFLKYLMEDGTTFSPFYAGIRTVIFLVTSCVLWGYLFAEVSGRDHRIAATVFSAILVTHPILSEQFYFKLQAAEVSLSFALMAVCLLHVHRFSLERKWISAIIAYLLMLLLFSVYQVMNALFLFGVGVCFFLHFICGERTWNGKEIWRYLWRVFVVFLFGFATNQAVTRLWFTGTDYISSQVRWGTVSPAECLRQMIRHVAFVCMGRGLYSETYVFLAAGGVCLCVFFCKREEKERFLRMRVVAALASILFIIAGPFYMTVISGGETVLRSQLVLPFSTAFLGYCTVLCAEKIGGRWRVPWGGVLVATVILQGLHSLALGKTEALRYAEDVRRAQEICLELEKKGIEEGTPIVFVGGLEETGDYVYGDCIGQSLFAWDVEVEPYSYHSSRRILGFLRTQGYVYAYPTVEQVTQGVACSAEMPRWPEEGSIKRENGYAIVNFW